LWRLSGIGKPVILLDTIPFRDRKEKTWPDSTRQVAANGGNELAAICCNGARKCAALCRLMTPAVAAICRIRGVSSSEFNFHLLRAQFSATGLCCLVMTETAQPKRGGRAYHSVLEPHFDFIHQQRQRRKTWQEIADLLFSEKDIRVTFYAPYRFYRRKLKRAAKANWDNAGNNSERQPARPSATASRPPSRPAPLPPSPDFKRPDQTKLNTDNFT